MSAIYLNHIGGVMVNMLVDRGFEHQLGQTKDYTLWYLLVLHYARNIKEKE